MKSETNFISNDGTSFFKCSGEEALVAQNAIQSWRAKQFENHIQLKLEFQQLLEKIRHVPVSESKIYALDGVNAPIISDMFRHIESQERLCTHIFINAVRYADLRLWPQGFLDVEIEDRILQTGLLARLWDTPVVVNKDIPPDEIVVVSSEDDMEDLFVRWKMEFTGKPHVDSVDDQLKRINENLRQINEKLGLNQNKE